MEIIREITLKSMENKIIRYFILKNCESAFIKYGIGIQEVCDGKFNEEKIENISSNKDFVLELIDYLCDHAIDTTHFRDIVEDFNLLKY